MSEAAVHGAVVRETVSAENQANEEVVIVAAKTRAVAALASRDMSHAVNAEARLLRDDSLLGPPAGFPIEEISNFVFPFHRGSFHEERYRESPRLPCRHSTEYVAIRSRRALIELARPLLERYLDNEVSLQAALEFSERVSMLIGRPPSFDRERRYHEALLYAQRHLEVKVEDAESMVALLFLRSHELFPRELQPSGPASLFLVVKRREIRVTAEMLSLACVPLCSFSGGLSIDDRRLARAIRDYDLVRNRLRSRPADSQLSIPRSDVLRSNVLRSDVLRSDVQRINVPRSIAQQSIPQHRVLHDKAGALSAAGKCTNGSEGIEQGHRDPASSVRTMHDAIAAKRAELVRCTERGFFDWLTRNDRDRSRCSSVRNTVLQADDTGMREGGPPHSLLAARRLVSLMLAPRTTQLGATSSAVSTDAGLELACPSPAALHTILFQTAMEDLFDTPFGYLLWPSVAEALLHYLDQLGLGGIGPNYWEKIEGLSSEFREFINAEFAM
ncbi:MAG: hypothetical protein IT290_09015 [Deltaproteobacteria bacterium]|nr:hypothetical protein [Deltaproteobacteria bacterium]